MTHKITTYFLSLLIAAVALFSCTFNDPLWEIIEEYEKFQEDLKDDDFPWPKTSPSDISSQLSFYQSTKERLEDIDTSRLTQEELINYEMLLHIVSDKVYNLDYGSYFIPINSEGGFVTGIIYGVQNVTLSTSEELTKYINRLRSLPKYIDNRIDNLSRGLETGKKSSKHVTSKFLDILELQIESGRSENIFSKPIENYAGEISEEVTKEMNELISKEIPASYQKLYNFIQDTYLPKAYDVIGAGQLPQGSQFYEQRAQFFTTLDISPEEVFTRGQEEVARIKSEMESIISEVGFDGTWEEFFHYLRTDPQFYAQNPDELLMRASWICKEMEFMMPKYFGRLPRMPFGVKPVPAAIAPNYTAGRYSGGSYEDNRAGQYWVNTTKLESRPLYALPALSLHEAVPGHHTQNMLAQELEGLPKFRNTYLSAFGEGWGLYSEFLGIEAGIYKSPYEHFGRLTYEMWRACRLVVDVGMHYKDWSREKAFEFMASNTALSLHEVNTEIDRYIGWPGQAISYKIGELKIKELRKRAEEELGDDFDIREFHDKVLENGAIPLMTLDRIIEAYIVEKKSSSS